MTSKRFWLVMLVITLVFGLTVIGCDDGTDGGGSGGSGSGVDVSGGGGGGSDTWTDVTSLSQIDGSWKYPSSASGQIGGYNVTTVYNNCIMTFNATAKTWSQSGSATVTYSGVDDATWTTFKTAMQAQSGQNGITYSNFNDENHSYTITYNNYTITLPNEDILSKIQINQKGTKIKIASEDIEDIDIEIILTKV